MAGLIELDELLKTMSPSLQAGEFVFCTVNMDMAECARLEPLAMFRESEGLTLITSVETADRENLDYEMLFKQITLTVHSSLDAVGLTAAVSAKLTARNISANVVAAYYHDHIFVQSQNANDAIAALSEFN